MSRSATVQSGFRRIDRAAVGRIATAIVAGTWLIHGLVNKVLGASPRHLLMIQSMPGLAGAAGEYARTAIGLGEVGLAIWVLSGMAPRLCAAAQTMVLLSMNVLELTYSRELLLWPAGLIPVNLLFLALAWTAADRSGRVGLRTRLRRHPLPIVAHFRECVTLTYAVPADTLQSLVPPGLELETLRGYGFVAVAMVQTESLRPAGLPPRAGRDFFLTGYRVFTTCRRPDGRTLRGLRILRSDADRLPMVIGGNLMTHYNYHRCNASIETSGEQWRITVRSRDGGGDLDATITAGSPALPAGSPFESWREARRFAGPLPFTFDYEDQTHAVVAIGATRANWRPAPVNADVRTLSFFERAPFRDCAPVLAAAFVVRNIDYRWARGEVIAC